MKTNVSSPFSPARTLLFALAALYSLPSFAQTLDFQRSIDSSAEALILLDVKASDCLAALDADDNAQALCDDFLDGIDGELMATYLETCSALKRWRDDYVEQTVAEDPAADTDSDGEMLRRLVAVEYYCGENTVTTRTQFVFTAFNRLSSGVSGAGTNSSAAASRQFSEYRLNRLDTEERQRLQNSLDDQRRRSQQDVDRQFNDLENELIRQRLPSSNWQN